MGNRKTTRAAKEKRVVKGFDNKTVLEQLLELARSLEVLVRQEKGDFRGGSCRLEEESLLFLRKMDANSVKIETLARELAKLPSDHIEIDPMLRQYLNQWKEENNVAV